MAASVLVFIEPYRTEEISQVSGEALMGIEICIIKVIGAGKHA